MSDSHFLTCLGVAIIVLFFFFIMLTLRLSDLGARMQKAESRIRAIESQIYPLPSK